MKGVGARVYHTLTVCLLKKLSVLRRVESTDRSFPSLWYVSRATLMVWSGWSNFSVMAVFSSSTDQSCSALIVTGAATSCLCTSTTNTLRLRPRNHKP